MKKTFLLLFSIGTLSTVFAQNGRNDSRDVILGRDEQRGVVSNSLPGRDNRNDSYNNERRRREEIDRISRDYDRRIEAVRRDRRLRSSEKNREIARLQREKEQAIRDINARYARQAPQRDNRAYGRY